MLLLLTKAMNSKNILIEYYQNLLILWSVRFSFFAVNRLAYIY